MELYKLTIKNGPIYAMNYRKFVVCDNIEEVKEYTFNAFYRVANYSYIKILDITEEELLIMNKLDVITDIRKRYVK